MRNYNNFKKNNVIDREKLYFMRYCARRVLYTVAGKIEKTITGKRKFF